MKESEFKEVKSDLASMNIMKKEFEEHKKNNIARITEMQKQLNAAHDDAKELRIKQRDMKKDLDSKQQVTDELNVAIESLTSRFERDKAHLLADIESLTTTMKSYQDQIAKERSTMATLRAENDTISSQCRKLNDKNSSLNTENTALKSKIQQLEGYVEQRIIESNAGLRHFSQNTPTAKKNSMKEEVFFRYVDHKWTNELS
jgi:chromosome segregation ATPase